MFRSFASILERKQREGIHLSVGCLILIFSTVISCCAILATRNCAVDVFIFDGLLFETDFIYFSTWRNPTISAADIYVYMGLHVSS